MSVALEQGSAAEDGRDQRRDQHRDDDVLVVRAAGAEGAPTSSDTVNPIPPSRPTAPTSGQPRPGASAAA